MQTKYPLIAMSAVFDRVKNAQHWKNPIDTTIVVRGEDVQRELDVIREAVIFYTGSVPMFQDCGPSLDGTCFRVTAAGYFLTIGA